MLKKTLISAAVTASLFALSVPASADTLTNWFLDTNSSSNAGGLISVQDYLDLTGIAYVHNNFTSPSTFTFQEAGSFLVLTADGVTPLVPSITANFLGTGAGNTALQTLGFNSGTLSVFDSALNQIATFNLLTGSANLQANSTLPNGTVSIIFQATQMMSGYFFDSGMNDLSTLVTPGPDSLVLGFATTNVISRAGQTVPTSLTSAYNAAFNPDVTDPVVANNSTDLYLSNNGQYRLAVVPEPGMLGLLGIGLAALGFSARRGKKA